MYVILSVIAPVFALILCGFVAAKVGLIGREGAKAISDFVVYFCLPPLVFRTLATVDLSAASPFGIWSAYYVAVAVIWLIAGLFARHAPGLGDAGGAAAAFAATFGNIGMMGLSIAYLAYGEEGLVIAALLIALHAATHWFFGSIWAEIALRREALNLRRLSADVARSLLKNPVIATLAFSSFWYGFGFETPDLAQAIIDLAGDAAVPAGLFALGLTIASYPMRGNLPAIGTIMALKMVLFPLLAWGLAVFVFELDAREVALVTLFAAMPTGMNAYFFSMQFKASTPPISGAIALGVLASAVTIPAILWITGAQAP